MSLEKLDQALRAAGIPIDGVSGDRAQARIDFQSAASAQDRARAASILAAFDWSPRAPRKTPDLLADLQKLPPADHQKLVDLVLADWLARHPQAGNDQGVPIVGDEIA